MVTSTLVMQAFTRRFVGAKAWSVEACFGFFGAGVYGRAGSSATVWSAKITLISRAW